MAYRKVTVEVKVKLTMLVDEGTEACEVVDDMDYNFIDQTGNAIIEDTEIMDHEITGSR